jgi:hypothetical protein
MTIYFNIKTSQGVETIDEFTRGEHTPQNLKEFKAYLNTMLNEYHMTGQIVYKSNRSTKDWREKK